MVNKNKNLSRGKKVMILTAAFITLIIASGIAVICLYRPYTAVHLSNGALYFGRARVFPGLALSDVYMIQSGENGVISLQKMKDVFWKPGDEMKINRDQVMFTVRLSDDSPIIKAIKGEEVPGTMTEDEIKKLQEQSEANKAKTGDESKTPGTSQ